MKAVKLVVLGDEKEGCVFDLNTISAIFKEGSSWMVYRTEGHLKLTLTDKYYEELLTHIPRGSSECQQLNEENKKLRGVIKDMTGCDPNFNKIESTTTKAPIPVENLEKIGRQQTETIQTVVTDATNVTQIQEELNRYKLALKRAELELANVHERVENANARAKAGDSLLVSVCRERDELRQQVAKIMHTDFTENVLKGKRYNNKHATLDEVIAVLRKAQTECVGKDRLIVDVSIVDSVGDEPDDFDNSYAHDRTWYLVK